MNEDVFFKAMLARDHRFDGKFYVGVKTTGIYCRPICPAKPKRKNVEFFSTAVLAEKAGYRPCLRCRPEAAPLSPAWHGKSALVQRAIRVLASDVVFSDEEKFAEQFGVTARHLRRLFTDEVGLTPKQIAFNNRLGFARKLIVESELPMTSIALTAGFGSLRRFNDSFRKRFKRTPSELRKKQHHADDGVIQLTLAYRPPLDFAHALTFYRSHAISGVENVTHGIYERVSRVDQGLAFIRVMQEEASSKLVLQITTNAPGSLFMLCQRVRRMFDLDSDPLLIANSFEHHPFLNSLITNSPGLRLNCGWDPFETAVCTILGQLVSIEQARVLVRQLVENYGEPVLHPVSGEKMWLFPTADRLAESSLDAVRTTGPRRAAIRELARLVKSGELDLYRPKDPVALKRQLLSIKGVGEWSAEYILLRAFGETDAFPATDLILKQALQKHPDIDWETIRPWRSYAAVYLWHHYAAKLSKKKGKPL